MGMGAIEYANAYCAWREQKAYAEAGSRALNNLANLYGVSPDPPVMLHSLPSPTYPTECPSCHSHEFRMHHGRWVCSFCRSSA